MNGIVKQWVVVFERALHSAYAYGPFDSEDEATKYAENHHRFPQVWRVVELKYPES